jgi:hypothetical protein
MNGAKKARITDIAAREISAIFEEHKGEQWQPINPDARVLLVKGGPKDGLQVKGSGKFLERLKETVKGVFGPVSVDVDDDIDNDGDGSDDYNQIAGMVQTLAWDINSAWGISDAEARAVGVKCAIDNFLDSLDDLRGSDDDSKGAPIDKGLALALVTSALKAGKRHSAADQAHLDQMKANMAQNDKLLAKVQANRDDTKKHLDLLMKNQPDNDDATGQDDSKARPSYLFLATANEADQPTVDVGPVGEDGNPSTYTVRAFDTEKAELVFGEWYEKAATEGKYGSQDDAGYADEKNKKYPLKKGGKDDEERIRAAWSYINMPKNAAKYSSDELSTIKSKIRAAMKRIGAEVEDDKGAVVTPSTADVEKAVSEAVATAMATAKGEFDSKLNDAVAKVKSDSDAAITAVKTEHKAQLKALQGELDEANGVIKGMVKDARKPTSSGAVPTFNEDGSQTDPAHEVTRDERVKAAQTDKNLSPIGRVIAAQRAASN